jgi:hypothetical protein
VSARYGGVTAQSHFDGGRKPAEVIAIGSAAPAFGVGREEGGFGKIHFTRDLLHPVFGRAGGKHAHGGRIAGEGRIGECIHLYDSHTHVQKGTSLATFDGMAESRDRLRAARTAEMNTGAKVWTGIAMLMTVWCVSQLEPPEDGAWAVVPGAQGKVRILQFRASVGALTAGEKAQLCYGVANARSVRIAPMAAPVYPSSNRCLEIGPRHTTHYTLMATGYDGSVATRSLTLAVQAAPLEVPEPREYARLAVTAATP